MSTTLMTIGDLTLDAIGTARVRTEYEGATIEGLITSLDLTIEGERIRRMNGQDVEVVATVLVDLTLGRISLAGLRRSHPCEVVS